MGYRTTVQIFLIIVSVVIVTTYIRPTFDEMRATQDETREYREALDNAAKFNEELQRLVNTANSFSTSERRALERYLPSDVDTVAVMRDIETIVGNNRMELLGLASEGELAPSSFTPAQGQNTRAQSDTTDMQLSSQDFQLQVSGSYEQFKTLLQDFERNAYPLEAVSIDFSPTEASSYVYTLTLETYAFTRNTSAQ